MACLHSKTSRDPPSFSAYLQSFTLKPQQPHSSLQAYDFVELFAGAGVTSSVLRKAGKSCASLDLEHHRPEEGKQNYMDLLSPSGFALLELTVFSVFGGLGCAMKSNFAIRIHSQTG